MNFSRILGLSLNWALFLCLFGPFSFFPISTFEVISSWLHLIAIIYFGPANFITQFIYFRVLGLDESSMTTFAILAFIQAVVISHFVFKATSNRISKTAEQDAAANP